MQIYSIPNYNTNSRTNFKALKPQQGGQALRDLELGLSMRLTHLTTARSEAKTNEEIGHLDAQIAEARAGLARFKSRNCLLFGCYD